MQIFNFLVIKYESKFSSLFFYSVMHAICATTMNYSDSAEPQKMSEEEMLLYKLYRPERLVPKKRGIDLLNDSRVNKVRFDS